MKTINADTLINLIPTPIYTSPDGQDLVQMSDVMEAIKRASTIEVESHWIPVNERPPEEGERILCTHLGGLNPNRQVIEHIYKDGQFVLGWEMDMNPNSPTFMQRYMGKIVAWMPLPKPYKGDELNEQT